jgi:hypothetical protein
MPATVIAIADAVVSTLNAAAEANSLSLYFVAERAYVPVYDSARDFVDLKVTVVPHGLTFAALARRSDDFDYVVDVAVQKRIEAGAKTAAEIAVAADPLMVLVEEMLDLFRGKRMDAHPDALCVEGKNEPIYLPPHLDENRVFTSVLSLTFREARAQTDAATSP